MPSAELVSMFHSLGDDSATVVDVQPETSTVKEVPVEMEVDDKLKVKAKAASEAPVKGVKRTRGAAKKQQATEDRPVRKRRALTDRTNK